MMPLFIVTLCYALGALFFTFIALSLNKNYKWITLKELNHKYEGDTLKFLLVIGLIFWPVTIVVISISKCITLFIDFCKHFIPEE